jgi:hypothetical protein
MPWQGSCARHIEYMPSPSTFIIHEMRVRGYHPFHITAPEVPIDGVIDWQDWVITSDFWDNAGGHFHRHRLHGIVPELPQTPQMSSMIVGGVVNHLPVAHGA